MVTKVKSRKTYTRKFNSKTIKRGGGSRRGFFKGKKHTFKDLENIKNAVNTSKEYEKSPHQNLYIGSNPGKIEDVNKFFSKPRTSRQHGVAKYILNYIDSPNKNFNRLHEKLYPIYGNKENVEEFKTKLRNLLDPQQGSSQGNLENLYLDVTGPSPNSSYLDVSI